MTDPGFGSSQAPAFLKAWDDYAAACQALFERLSNPSADVGQAIPLAFFGAWKDFAKNLGMRSDFAAGGQFKPEEVFASLAPALGYGREYQEILQRMMNLSRQFQQRYAEFVQQGADIGQRALLAVQKRTASNAPPSGSPTAIYDAWIDSAEEAYTQAAHGESFARLLADLCNTMSAFKVERGKLLEAFARQMDLPSRAEVDSLHRQIRDLTIAVRNKPVGVTRPTRPKTRKPSGRAGK